MKGAVVVFLVCLVFVGARSHSEMVDDDHFHNATEKQHAIKVNREKLASYISKHHFPVLERIKSNSSSSTRVRNTTDNAYPQSQLHDPTGWKSSVVWVMGVSCLSGLLIGTTASVYRMKSIHSRD